MRKKLWIGLALLLVLPGLLFTASCAKKMVKDDEKAAAAQGAAAGTGTGAGEAGGAEGAGKSASGLTSAEEAARKALEAKLKAMTPEERAAYERQMKMERAKFVNEDIYFEYDKSTLTPMAQAVLKRKADFLLNSLDSSVTIEGHCDERGTNEYNLALGDRRAESAKRYLVNLGVSPARLATVSYGEENPVDPGHDEEAWAKNRRGHFLIE